MKVGSILEENQSSMLLTFMLVWCIIAKTLKGKISRQHGGKFGAHLNEKLAIRLQYLIDVFSNPFQLLKLMTKVGLESKGLPSRANRVENNSNALRMQLPLLAQALSCQIQGSGTG